MEKGILKVTTVMLPKGSWKWQDRCAVRIVEIMPYAKGHDLRFRGVSLICESHDLAYGTRKYREMIMAYEIRLLEILAQRAKATALECMLSPLT